MKFVLATDGSGYSRIAEETLVHLDSGKQADWEVVSVAVPLPVATPSAGSIGLTGEDHVMVWRAIREAQENMANEVTARLLARGYKAKASVLEGDSGQEILDFCEREKPDIVALGSRGLGSFLGFLLGSTARKLIANAPCSVLIGHCPKDQDPDAYAKEIASKPKLDVLIGTDGSDGAQQAISKLVELGPFARGTVVCVEPLAVVPLGLNPADFGRLYQWDEERCARIAEGAAERLLDTCSTVVPISEVGRPATVLVNQAKKVGAELIVLGATRHGIIERFLLGSVSYEVATEAPVPVLVVRVLT